MSFAAAWEAACDVDGWLTEAQARRLWGLDEASCGALLGALVDAKFLFKTRDGAFMRIEHAQPLKVTPRPRHAAA